MPMKPRYLNSIPAAAKPRKPICGPTAATTCNRGRKSWSSTIKPDAAVAIRNSFYKTGHGHLLDDDYGGYKALFAAARAHPQSKHLLEPCIELGCMAHARRKFFDTMASTTSFRFWLRFSALFMPPF
jgi:hypothetical protein